MLWPSEASVSWASTVMPGCGTTSNLWIRMPRPISIAPSRMPSQTSVAWARRSRGWRNSGTALAMASTPVSAEQPEANARRMSRTPTASVAGARWWPSGTAGWVRTRPPRITAAMATMNSSVGTVKTLADSATPQVQAGDQGQRGQAEPDPAAVERRERGGEGGDAGRHADRGVQHVVDDQRRGGHQAGPGAQVRLGHRVCAAATGERLDHLAVGHHQRGEQEDDRTGDRQRVVQRGRARRDQDDEDGLRAVGYRGQ